MFLWLFINLARILLILLWSHLIFWYKHQTTYTGHIHSFIYIIWWLLSQLFHYISHIGTVYQNSTLFRSFSFQFYSVGVVVFWPYSIARHVNIRCVALTTKPKLSKFELENISKTLDTPKTNKMDRDSYLWRSSKILSGHHDLAKLCFFQLGDKQMKWNCQGKRECELTEAAVPRLKVPINCVFVFCRKN